MKNARVSILCDNEAVVHMVNNMMSNCEQCMKLIRIFAMENIIFHRKLFVRHIRSEKNILPYALSRLDWRRFWINAPETMRRYPDNLPEQIWLVTKIWDNEFDYLALF